MEIEHKFVIQSNTGTACTSIIKNLKKNLSLVNICYCCRVDLWNILCLFTCVYACMHKKKNSKTHLQFFLLLFISRIVSVLDDVNKGFWSYDFSNSN